MITTTITASGSGSTLLTVSHLGVVAEISGVDSAWSGGGQGALCGCAGLGCVRSE